VDPDAEPGEGGVRRPDAGEVALGDASLKALGELVAAVEDGVAVNEPEEP
jgi:hypothetical protein